MRETQHRRRVRLPRRLSTWAVWAVTAGLLLVAPSAHAITPIPDPAPSADSYGLEATKPQPPPTTTATISTPNNGASFTTTPTTVTGLCTTGLLVQVYDNGVFVGAINCTTGSFSIQVTLFTGQNELDAIQYDDLSQASPISNQVTVTYNNSSFSAFGTLITLTSDYGRRAADPGDTLTWPLLLSGGTGPYAFSVDWGDGTAAQLISQPTQGTVNISHVYNQSGIYHVVVKVADKNGVTAFLQLVAVANGQPSGTGAGTTGTSSSPKSSNTAATAKVMWWPAATSVVLLMPAYWLGRRSELISLHRKLEHDMKDYKDT